MQNKLNPMRDNSNEANMSEQNEQVIAQVPFLTYPPIAGFWRRFFAWTIDTVLLGVIGQIIGVVFSSYLFSIGPYGRPIGLLLIIPYFGILNSKIGGGQTLGKRWMKIAVRNQNNEPIELWRSIIRILILYLPILFNGWSIPLFQNTVVSWIVSIIVFGFGAALPYTMVFNKKSRQGFHDMLLGTYVIHLPGKAIASFPKTKRIHWIIPYAIIATVAIGFWILTTVIPSAKNNATIQPLMDLNNFLQTDSQFVSTEVLDYTSSSSTGDTRHYLVITGWYKEKINNTNQYEIALSLVKKVLGYFENLSQYDAIQVKITSGFDIGISSISRNASFTKTIENWRNEVH